MQVCQIYGPVQLSVLLHHTLCSGVERVTRLADKFTGAKLHHLLNGQTLALAQHFQSPHFFI